MNSLSISVVWYLGAIFASGALFAANPYLPLWEHVPDGEPYVFDDPANPGKKRVYIYGSHDSQRTLPCGREHVVWSAPVEDLNKWRFDGVIFRSVNDANGNPLDKTWLGDQLYAPDVALKTGTDGKKTYFLIPNNMTGKRKSMIAKSDRPDGPFKVCNWDSEYPKHTVGCLGSDPAVFVDDDGRVYGYWGFWRSMAAELDPETMATLKPGTKVIEDMVSGAKQPGVFRFYEASSMRKVKDKYVFIYSRWTEEGEFGLKGAPYTLAYAYSDKPLGPWTYGGTLIDARAREKRPDGKTVVTATSWGNTHGSICEINGKWYVFYHRQCGLQGLSRQAMVAPITVEVEDGPGGKVRISEAEYTSEGFETDGLDPFGWHPAGITCYYVGGPYVRPWHADGYEEADPYDLKINRSSVVNIISSSVVGYKYFDFGKTYGRKQLRLEMKLLPLGERAKMEVWTIRPNAAEGGIKLGEVAFSGDEGVRPVVKTVDVAPLAAVDGRKALFFVFYSARKGYPICEMEGFRFTCAPESQWNGYLAKMEQPAPETGVRRFRLDGFPEKVYYDAQSSLEHGSGCSLAVVVIHGWGGGFIRSKSQASLIGEFKKMKRFGEAVPYVIAPLFPRDDLAEKQFGKVEGLATWNRSWSKNFRVNLEVPGDAKDDWRGGGDAMGTSLSSYDVVDRIFAMLGDRRRFPNLKKVVLTGFSAGGQFVGRYAAVGKGKVRDGVKIAYAAMAPSTELRFEPEVRWHYGLKGRPRYAAALTEEAIMGNLSSRRVWRGCGSKDVLGRPRTSLDSCAEAMAQGTNRFDRFRKFETYLNSFPEWSKQVSFHVFEGLGHDSAAAHRDPAFLAYVMEGL